MSSGHASIRCLRCGAYTDGVTQVCADCVDQQRVEEAARAERVAQTIADRPGGAGSAAANLCSSCGRYANPGAEFCGYCRHQLGSAAGATEFMPATGQRFVAGLIDGVLLFALFTAMAFALSGTEQTENGQMVRIGLRNEEYLLYLGIVYLYFVAFEMLAKASLGKLVMGLTVVKINGQPYDLGAILVRNIIRFIDSIPLGLYIVGLITIAVTEKKQRLGDLVVGTTVVKSR